GLGKDEKPETTFKRQRKGEGSEFKDRTAAEEPSYSQLTLKSDDADSKVTWNGLSKYDRDTNKPYIYKIVEVGSGKESTEKSVTLNGQKYNVKIDNKEVHVGDESDKITFVITNTKDNNDKKGKFEILKVDSESGEELEGVEFELQGNSENNKDFKQTLKTDSSGKVIVENLEAGKYKLKESKPKDGYQLIDTEWNIEVTSEGKVTGTQIQNTDIKVSKKEFTADSEKTGDFAPSYKFVENSKYKAINETPILKEFAEGNISKKILNPTDLENNKYKIELTVEGKSRLKSQDKPLDIVIMLDNSNTMENSRGGGQQRATKSKEAVQKLAENILSNPENRVALVTYGSVIFDGNEKTVYKGVQDKNGKKFNDSVSFHPSQVKFKARVRNLSYLDFTNNINNITERLKDVDKVPKVYDADKQELIQYQFGATFTQKAFMQANAIFKEKARSNSEKIILHITDGVPTMSYPIDFSKSNYAIFAKKLTDLINRSGNNGLKEEYFITNDTSKIKGNGESYNLFEDPKVYYKGKHDTEGIKDSYLQWYRDNKYDVRTDLDGKHYIYRYWQENNRAYGGILKSGLKIKDHGYPTKLYFNTNIKPYYEVYTVGIGVKGDPGTDKATATKLMQSLSKNDKSYTNFEGEFDADKIVNAFKKQLDSKLQNSIIEGKVTDPMGSDVNIELKDGETLQPTDYTLEASDGSIFENGQYQEGSGQRDLLKKVRISYNGATKTIEISGLNLGYNDKITLTYNVSLKDDKRDGEFHRTNNTTTLEFKAYGEKGKTEEFPRPSIRDGLEKEGEERAILKITNKKKTPKAEVTFKKVSSEDSEKFIQGAKFNLYKQDVRGSELLSNSPKIRATLIKSDIESDLAGKVKLTDLEDGETYYLKETKPAPGYKTSSKMFEKCIRVENGEVKILNDTGSFEMQAETNTLIKNDPLVMGKIKILKVDEDNNKPLDGVIFTLTKLSENNTNPIKVEKSTNSSGEATFENLEEGKYLLEETKPKDGYQNNFKSKIISIEQGKVYEEQVYEQRTNKEEITESLKITNKKLPPPPKTDGHGELIINKLKQNGEKLEGAKYSLIDKGGVDLLEQLYYPKKGGETKLAKEDKVDGILGKTRIYNIPPGTYTLKEREAPNGYTRSQRSWTVVVYASGGTKVTENIYQPEEEAANPTDVSGKITASLTYKKVYPKVGSNLLSNGSTIYPNLAGRFELSFNLKANKGTTFNKGDYFYLDLGEELDNVGVSRDFNPMVIKGANEEPLAIGNYESESGTDHKGSRLKFVFTDYIKGLDNVDMNLSTPAFVRRDTVQNNQYINPKVTFAGEEI
ncbi:SpaA isopeptide-forming pilin-related protein, partial [Peptoniphilus asaccharolyticus]